MFGESQLWYSVAAMIILAVSGSVVGSLMIWNKIAYIGDSVAHASLAGVGISVVTGLNLPISIFCTTLLLSIFVTITGDNDHYQSNDTLLSIITGAFLAFGYILLTHVKYDSHEILHNMFGSVEDIDGKKFLIVCLASSALLLLTYHNWHKWILTAFSREVAISNGIKVEVVKAEYIISVACFAVISSYVIGVLLTGPFMVIPAAAARPISKTPTDMIKYSMIVSSLAIALGLSIWHFYPAINMSAIVIVVAFLILLAIRIFTKAWSFYR